MVSITSASTIDSFVAATFRSAQYQIQITQGSNYHVTTLNVLHDGTDVFLNEFGIEAKTFKDRIGIWVIKNKGISLKKEEKIGAIGLRLKKWTTYHGLSFNINPDLNYFKKIYPCGLKEYSTTSMKALGVNITNNEFDKLFLEIYLKELKKL